MRASGIVGSRFESELSARVQPSSWAEEKRSRPSRESQRMLEYGMLLIVVTVTVLFLSAGIRNGVLGVFQTATNVLR
jgi:hypothetical protein